MTAENRLFAFVVGVEGLGRVRMGVLGYVGCRGGGWGWNLAVVRQGLFHTGCRLSRRLLQGSRRGAVRSGFSVRPECCVAGWSRWAGGGVPSSFRGLGVCQAGVRVSRSGQSGLPVYSSVRMRQVGEVAESESGAFDAGLTRIVGGLCGGVGDAGCVPVRDLGLPALQGAAQAVDLTGEAGVLQLPGEPFDGLGCGLVVWDRVDACDGFLGVLGFALLLRGVAGVQQAP